MADVSIGGGLNTFVPTFSEATGLIQTEFTRNVKSFALNRYSKLVPVTTVSGYYLKINSDEAVRVIDEKDFRWAYGEDRPTGVNNDFDFAQFTTKRYEKGFHIPYETAKVASWDIVAQHARSRATQLMTLRTNRMLDVLTTAGNWTSGTNYFADFDTFVNQTNTANGVYQDDSSTATGVQRLFQTAIEKIMINTGGAVQPQDIVCVMGPQTAFKLSQTAQLRELIKYTQGVQLMQGQGNFSRYGLSPSLFGIGDIVIEDAVKVTSAKGATRAASYILGTDKVLFLSRPQGLVGVEGGANFATVTNFVYEDMTVETFDDPRSRRTVGSIVDNSVPEITAPLAGLYIANIGT
jgi:hypothetical protein